MGRFEEAFERTGVPGGVILALPMAIPILPVLISNGAGLGGEDEGNATLFGGEVDALALEAGAKSKYPVLKLLSYPLL